MTVSLGLDIGSNSVGSAWVDLRTGRIVVGLSVFPAGVDESDEKRGDPKNTKRRMARRSRITLARRAQRKRGLRLKLIAVGLLPADPEHFKRLLEEKEDDPWALRRRGLTASLLPHQFGRVLLHLAQRRGALGFDADVGDKGKVKGAIVQVQLQMLDRYGSEEAKRSGRGLRTQIEALTSKKKRTELESEQLDRAQEELKRLCQSLLRDPAVSFGRLIADLRDQRRTPITATPDRRKGKSGPREWRQAVRNRTGRFEFHADRAMIRDEFAKLWDAQKRLGGPLARVLTDDLRRALDDESHDSVWRHKGLLFGQRMQSWDLGTLGRCVLEPTERCAPHADMYASHFLVVETVNNLKIIESGREKRALTCEERTKIKNYLSGPLGVESRGKRKGQPKRKATVSGLRELMGWGPATKNPRFRFSIESDEERTINTDWFSREIIHGAVGAGKWNEMHPGARERINRAILKCDPDDEKQAARLKDQVMDRTGLTETEADALVAAWKKRPRPDANRLNMSRRAVRNLLTVMDRDEPWPDPDRPGQTRWLTQIEARKLIAEDAVFVDVTTCRPLDEHARRRYATGAKGATARDRHYLRKHLLMKKKQPVYGPDGLPLHEPPPAPLISNPVVRKAIHEVRRHLVEYLTEFGRKPDEIGIELAREAKMGKVDADRVLLRNRLRNRIKNDIIESFDLGALSSTQREEAVKRVVLCVQQRGICPLCGDQRVTAQITPRTAANGEGCELAHIIPKGCGGHNGFTNIVLAHQRCNREMGRRTPRQFWEETLTHVPLGKHFEEGIRWVEGIYSDVKRPRLSEVKKAEGDDLWSCYFAGGPGRWGLTFDQLKIEQFKKEIKDIQEMTPRQLAATRYASRQVMAYLADAVFDGKGLPERGGERKFFPCDGLWTSRLRREWGLFFDPHDFKAKGLTNDQEQERKEKDRGDHRHHAIDAIVIALCSRQVQIDWEEREKRAEEERVNTASEEAMENYRKHHRLPPPAPFKSREEFQEAVRRAVFGEGAPERPVCHRPVKRKLIGALHKATQYGAVVDAWVSGGVVHRELVPERVTIRQDVIGEAPKDFLKPAHLRMPVEETDQQAVKRLARRLRVGNQGLSFAEAAKLARKLVKSKAFTRAKVDPPPEKGGIVRDIGLRRLLRRRLVERGLNPDAYTKSQLKQSIDEHGPLTHDSGVPIHRVVLLWSNTDPVAIRRDHYDYASGKPQKLDDPAALRLYDSQNNHHIEIRVAKNKKGKEVWSGHMERTFDVSKVLLERLRKLGELEKPFRHLRKKLTKQDKAGLSAEQIQELSRRRLREWKQALRDLRPQRKAILEAHPLIDRSDNDAKGGRFVMSLCEGEMLLMKHKRSEQVGYFVVAKLDKPQTIVVVPHWDARPATERKDPNDPSGKKKIPNSGREQFDVTPSDLSRLAPPGYPHAVKVAVDPLGRPRPLQKKD